MDIDKILIADDDEYNRAAVKEAIPRAEIVDSAEGAIIALDWHRYDL